MVVSLPLFHLLFPPVALIVASVGGFFFFVGYSIGQVHEGKNWFKPWSDLPDIVKQFWRWHVEFVEEVIKARGLSIVYV